MDMAKRFIDTDLFKKPFMRSLEAPYKALWVYLLCECDHAGVWTVELDVAQLRMGMKLDAEKALEKMGGAAIAIDGGSKWFLPDFVAFQYGTLNPANRVHESVLAILSKYGIDIDDMAKNKPLTSPLQGAKDKDKDKDTSEKKERANEVEIVWPSWAGPQTLARWEEFKSYRWEEHKVKYKSPKTEQQAVNILAKFYTNGKQCVDALDTATGKLWKFPVDPADLAAKSNGFSGKPIDATITNREYQAGLAKARADLGIPPGGLILTEQIPEHLRKAKVID